MNISQFIKLSNCYNENLLISNAILSSYKKVAIIIFSAIVFKLFFLNLIIKIVFKNYDKDILEIYNSAYNILDIIIFSSSIVFIILVFGY